MNDSVSYYKTENLATGFLVVHTRSPTIGRPIQKVATFCVRRSNVRDLNVRDQEALTREFYG